MDGLVLTGRRETLAFLMESDTLDIHGVDERRSDLLAGRGVPEVDPAADACLGQPTAISTEGNRADGIMMRRSLWRSTSPDLASQSLRSSPVPPVAIRCPSGLNATLIEVIS